MDDNKQKNDVGEPGPFVLRLPENTQHLRCVEVPRLIADALKPEHFIERYAILEKWRAELDAAIRSGELTQKYPKSHRQDDAVVNVDDLRKFGARRGLDVVTVGASVVQSHPSAMKDPGGDATSVPQHVTSQWSEESLAPMTSEFIRSHFERDKSGKKVSWRSKFNNGGGGKSGTLSECRLNPGERPALYDRAKFAIWIANQGIVDLREARRRLGLEDMKSIPYALSKASPFDPLKG